MSSDGTSRVTVLVMMPSLFPLGELVITPGAEDALARANVLSLDLVSRHANGDWGDLEEEDKQANDAGIDTGDRLLSLYQLATGEKVWVITEADRSATTILTPGEY